MPDPAPELLRQLYSTPPDRFVAARDEAVAAARAVGDRPAARQIAGLRRPTVAAWLVNLLALHRPELIADLVRLAEELRAAQRELRGARLRELSTQRRAVVGALVAEVRALAAEVERAPSVGKLPLAEVEATLNAALADTGIAEQVRSGRLLRAASYAGFGEVPRPQLRLLTGGAGAEPDTGEPAADQDGQARPGDAVAGRASGDGAVARQRADRIERGRHRRTLDRELRRAHAEQERAEAALVKAVRAERDGGAELAEIESALAEIERRRAIAEQEVSRRRLARRAAERTTSAARRQAGEIEAALEAFDTEEGDAGATGNGADSGV